MHHGGDFCHEGPDGGCEGGGEDIPVGDVEECGKRVYDGVDGEFFLLQLQERGGRVEGRVYGWGTEEGVLEMARGAGGGRAEGEGAEAGVRESEGRGAVDAVGEDAGGAVRLEGLGGGGVEFRADLVDDAHAVLEEEERGAGGYAVEDGAEGGDCGGGFDGDDEVFDWGGGGGGGVGGVDELGVEAAGGGGYALPDYLGHFGLGVPGF